MFRGIEMNQPSRTDLQRHKHINHAKATVTTVKKSQATIALACFFRKVDQRWSVDPRGPGRCLLYLATVRGESRICSFSNSSSAMRCSPQVGFSAARRRIKFLTSAVTGGLPTSLDFRRQKRRNTLRCQPIKVAGLTISNALRQSNQRASLENTNLSAGVVGIAFFSRSRKRANCLRTNRFSVAGAVRRRHTEAKKLKPSLTIVRRFRTILESRVKTLNIVQSSHANSVISDADRIFA